MYRLNLILSAHWGYPLNNWNGNGAPWENWPPTRVHQERGPMAEICGGDWHHRSLE